MNRIFPTSLSDTIRTIILLILLSLVVSFTLCYQIINVRGTSMLPTLVNGDVCLAQKICLKLNRGDLIGFNIKIQGRDRSLVKRIIGLPGETITILPLSIVICGLTERVFVIEENYLDPKIKNPECLTVTLEKDEYFVLGDNRQISAGSVQFGPVGRSHIKYKFILTLFRSF